jgi:hypothetical protein
MALELISLTASMLSGPAVPVVLVRTLVHDSGLAYEDVTGAAPVQTVVVRML